MRYCYFIGYFVLWCGCVSASAAAALTPRPATRPRRSLSSWGRRGLLVVLSSSHDTDAASKAIVSVLTDVVNAWSMITRRRNAFTTANDTSDWSNDDKLEAAITRRRLHPQSASELLERLRVDYQDKNYLWTGDLDLTCFDSNCRFTDPTISFVGTHQFVRNLQGLRPIVDRLIPHDAVCRSELLDIQLRQDHVETKWNMVGELHNLPWKPTINVKGRTRFWFHLPLTAASTADSSSTLSETLSTAHAVPYTVYFYDEAWDIPAAQALCQLVRPGQPVQT